MNKRIRGALRRYAVNIALTGLFLALPISAAACSSEPAKGTSVTLSNGETAGVIVTINPNESSTESSSQAASSESVTGTAGTGDDVVAVPTTPKPGQAYAYRYQNILILPGVDAATVVGSLTENCEITDTFEKDKKGADVIVRSYTFSSFVLYGRADSEGKYIITRIVLSGRDSVTPEGIGIGASHDDVIKVYGNQYTDNGNSITYTSGTTDLTFFFANGTVSDITYTYNKLS